MMTLGEALSPRYGAEWLTQTIIPGVKDGLKELGITEEPPIVVRAHATDIEAVMKAATPLYSNIYTMYKWNGESLTWTDVRGDGARECKMLVEASEASTSPTFTCFRIWSRSAGATRILYVRRTANLSARRHRRAACVSAALLGLAVRGRQHATDAAADRPRLDLVRSRGGATPGIRTAIPTRSTCTGCRASRKNSDQRRPAKKFWPRTRWPGLRSHACCRASALRKETARRSRWA